MTHIAYTNKESICGEQDDLLFANCQKCSAITFPECEECAECNCSLCLAVVEASKEYPDILG